VEHQDILSLGNIIVVDDEPENLRLIDVALRKKVASLRLFTRAVQAFESAKVEAPGLFLLDINMPHMNGFQLCQQIRNDEELKHIPVIFISCFCSSEDKIKGFESGCSDFITKPFEQAEFEARIKTHLSAHHNKIELQRKNVQLTHAMADNIAIKRRAIRYERSVAVSELTMLIVNTLNIPLGNAMGAMSASQELCIQTKDSLDSKNLTMGKLGKNLELLVQAGQLGLDNLDRTTELVTGLKLLSLNNEFSYHRTQMRDFINTVFVIFKHRHPLRQIKLSLHVDVKLVFVICPMVFKAILLALMENSLTYATNDVQHSLSVTVKKSLDEQSLLLNYFDDGMARDVEMMKDIFDPLSPTMINKGPRTLGLHLMKYLTDRLGAVCFPDINDRGAFEFGFKFPNPNLPNDHKVASSKNNNADGAI
jgi:DNA-binding response OmpR family regulator